MDTADDYELSPPQKLRCFRSPFHGEAKFLWQTLCKKSTLWSRTNMSEYEMSFVVLQTGQKLKMSTESFTYIYHGKDVLYVSEVLETTF